MNKIILLIFTIFSVLDNSIQAQQNYENQYPEIGKRCPDFYLDDINYYSGKNASMNNFKGKWLIIDFWTRGCSACFESFPETNTLQELFKEKVQFLLVGFTDGKSKKVTRALYERYRQRYSLALPVAYDSTLFYKFKIPSFPHVIWVDNAGIVKAITTAQSLKPEIIQSFLDGKNPQLPEKQNDMELQRNPYKLTLTKPFLINGNGGNDTAFFQRSVLTGWKKGIYSLNYVINQPVGFINPHTILLTNSSLATLYQAAYGDTIASYMARDPGYGKWWPKGPVLEMSDISQFETDFETGKNLYCYNLTVPEAKANKKSMKAIMQHDLQNFFGYEVSVENRKMPYWKLTVVDEAKINLFTKGALSDITGNYSGLQLINQPLTKVIEMIWGPHQNEPPFIDETGIVGNIDLNLNCILTDFDDLTKELKKSGLILQQSQRDMKVIVVRDAKRSLPY